jgi:hypothetical protein|tara:strand:+ start:1989 stop:2294 length:306 start_codon:yes stop_codon:yes gene_type:complete
MAKENVDYKLVEIIVDFDKWWGIELLKPPNEGLVIRYDKVGMHEEGEDKGLTLSFSYDIIRNPLSVVLTEDDTAFRTLLGDILVDLIEHEEAAEEPPPSVH